MQGLHGLSLKQSLFYWQNTLSRRVCLEKQGRSSKYYVISDTLFSPIQGSLELSWGHHSFVNRISGHHPEGYLLI